MQVLLTLLPMNAMNWLSQPNNQACALHHCTFVLSFTQLNKLSLAKCYVLVFVFQALPELPYPFTSIVFQALHKLPYPDTLVPLGEPIQGLYTRFGLSLLVTQDVAIFNLAESHILEESINQHDWVHKLALPLTP